MSRIQNEKFRAKLATAEEAAAMIHNGDNVGFSGFTGASYPKVLPEALAARARAAHARGEEFRIGVWTGASTAPELDGELAAADAVSFRMPYQSDPDMRRMINQGRTDYLDVHLSHSAPLVRQGFLGDLDVAIIEVTAITKSGELIPSTSCGNNNIYFEKARKIILEVNSWHSLELEGMHDVYYGTALPPYRRPVQILSPGARIGQTTFRVDPSKVVAVVETYARDRNSEFKAPDECSRAIAGNLIDFYTHEVKRGRLPQHLLPLQSGVGNIANAVLDGLRESPFDNLTSYTEVIQDGMIDLIDSGKMRIVSATGLSLSPEYADRMNAETPYFRRHIVLRPQEISNHPEVIRRLGVLATNGMIEADIYGNVNSTHIMGSKMMNGIGGSGDFSRNSFISAFVSPSVAKNGAISAIVPMVSHHDHTEHDVHVIITEQGLADLRGLAPRKRAKLIIDNCSHPDYRAELQDYYDRACRTANGLHTPHDLREAHSWHVRFLETGTMKA